MAAPFLAPNSPRRVLVMAPARQIRHQLFEQFSSYSLLANLGVLKKPGKVRVLEMIGRCDDWSALRPYDVVVALPNSISPSHYSGDQLPPTDLFDMVIIDEAHHAPADTWRAVLDYFSSSYRLLLTATPKRRDGKRIPGKLIYYYPLRRALDEGFYKPIDPVLLPVSDPLDRAACDRTIAVRAHQLLSEPQHQSSVLLVRASSIARLQELQAVYEDVGLDLALLHTRLGNSQQTTILEGLIRGTVPCVGVVGMLGEGFDLPSLRLVAYHDKYRSLPATIQLIGRLARVHPDHPQPSALITVKDVDIFPELEGIVRDLYEEDADWSEVLPGIIDDEIERERLDREFTENLPSSLSEVDPSHLEPLERGVIYEVPPDWAPPFTEDSLPNEFRIGSRVAGGTIIYSATNAEAGLLVLVLRHSESPRWTSDPALSNVHYELHVIAHRRSPRTDLPGLVFVNVERLAMESVTREVLGLTEVGHRAGPERIGAYLDSLERISVSSVGVRSTNAANRGRASYRSYMGSGVDRGLRTVDTARAALGHVMFQVGTSGGSATAGGAIEKSKIWVTRYVPLREINAWYDETAALLWFPTSGEAGPLLPDVERGHRVADWPEAAPLAAEMNPFLLGQGLEIWSQGDCLGAIEDLELFVNDDPTGTLSDIGSVRGVPLPMVALYNDRENDRHILAWTGELTPDGGVSSTQDVEVRRGYSGSTSLSELLEHYPPTVYFLDGTTTLGSIEYQSRPSTLTFDFRLLHAIDWSGVDLTAETDETATAHDEALRSIHSRLGEHLAAVPRRGLHRWILYNHGSGELADYVVVEELASGEVHLALWHAKASGGSLPGLRVKDMQEVVAQAIRSRRWFPSTRLWREVAARLVGEAKPDAVLIDGSDNETLLQIRLGLEDPDDSEVVVPWTNRFPVVRGLIGIVQPGLSSAMFREQLNTSETAASLRELFNALADTALADGADIEVLVST